MRAFRLWEGLINMNYLDMSQTYYEKRNKSGLHVVSSKPSQDVTISVRISKYGLIIFKV